MVNARRNEKSKLNDIYVSINQSYSELFVLKKKCLLHEYVCEANELCVS